MRATSDNRLLSAYAVRRADGTLTLLVINKSPGATVKADLAIAGFRPEPGAMDILYGISQDEAARTGIGSTDIAQSAYRCGGSVSPRISALFGQRDRALATPREIGRCCGEPWPILPSNAI